MSQSQATSGASEPSTRVERFQEDVGELNVPVPSVAAEKRWLVGGTIMIVVGFVLVFVGYWGASGTVSPAEQLPYMLSGGAIGLGLVVVGAFLVGRFSMARLLRFWLALLVAEHRHQTDRLIDAIESTRRSER